MLCLDSAIAGHGVMLAWQLLAADALADGRLVAPFGVRATSGLGYWLVSSANRTGGPQGHAIQDLDSRGDRRTIRQFGPLVCAQ